MLLVNLLPVRRYGQMEYGIGCIKITSLVILILINVGLSAKPRPFITLDNIPGGNDSITAANVKSVVWDWKPFFTLFITSKTS